MVPTSFLALASAALLLGSCQRPPTRTTAVATECIDPARIDPTGACTMDYNPVCGCNGQTYANPCAATKAGLRTFTTGPCPTPTHP
ncbi:kazal domain protein [Hymenobacter sp. HMF4947]|uniref:Kazal domain protein n=1 Tax=Hymenobacter ginkgonis TaxID=2682976 RepID=A0A7K1THA2_9BACT|nr:Kazal-type serine protease inhibitor domain-containing protein [Hymenobacter ginkgonis]MVN77768.1 kazal domain protein [Hymenobacter ginkgonis]